MKKLGISPLTSEVYLYKPSEKNENVSTESRIKIDRGQFIYCMVKYLEQNMGHDGITVITVNGEPKHEILLLKPNQNKLIFEDWYKELVKVYSLFDISENKMGDKDVYIEYYNEGLSPVDTYKEEVVLSNS